MSRLVLYFLVFSLVVGQQDIPSCLQWAEDGFSDATGAELLDGNQPPIADAGPDQTVTVGDVVQFDGSGSYDPDKGWFTEIVDANETAGYGVSIAVDSNDHPHMSYSEWMGFWNGNHNYTLKYATYDGGNWSVESLDAGYWAHGSSIALTSNDQPRIAYRNHPNHQDEVKYAKWDGSDWSYEFVYVTDSSGGSPSLALDSNDYPHISFYNFTHPGLKYAKWDGNRWVNETVDPGALMGDSLALDSNDYPHISYRYGIDKELRYAKWNGSGWEIESVETTYKLTFASTSIAVDDDDHPHIGYMIEYYLDVRYATWNGSAWIIETPDMAGETEWAVSIDLDSKGNPHMAYYDKKTKELRYARRIGGVWEKEVVDSSGQANYPLELALDSQDNPHIGYRKDMGVLPGHDGNLMYATTQGRIASYDWDFGDGSAHGKDLKPTHVYDSSGVYNVTLTVTDAQGANNTDNCIVTVLPKESPPVADAGGPYLGQEGTSIPFDGSGSSDPDGGTLSLTWDFDSLVDSDGDGNFINDVDATGPTPTHTYYDDGIYVVTLTVTDSQGLQDTDQCSITVLNVAPIPEWTSRSADGTILTPPYPEGKEILFEATVTDPGIYDTFRYDWDFGDGTVYLDAGPKVTYTYGDDKTYTVVLTVTDDDGGVGVDDAPPLPTTNEDPVPKIDLPFCIFVEGLDPCDAIGMFTDPGWLDTHSAVWDFGDGTTETAVLTVEHQPPDSTGWNLSSHLYGDNGLYTITFTVTDDDGGKGTATAEVPVQNHVPSFDLYVPITVNEGEQFVLGVEATDPGSDDLAISVDWGDGTSDSSIYYNDGVGPDPPNSGAGVFPFVVQSNFTHVYPDDGDYDVTVEVEDDDGGSDVKAFQIPVLNVAPTVTLEVLPIEVNASLRIAGEKWHDVTIELYEDGVLITSGTLVRYPGSPDDQRLDLTHLQVDYSKKYSAVVRYTPEDDPINGQPNGANPCWIILTFSDGQELWIHHTFNVQHPDTYVWEVDLTAAILMYGLTFQATAFDPGADDLTFRWDFGDGTNATSFYQNSNGTYPVEITESINHAFPGSGTYVVVLTVEDDDGGVGTASLTIVIP